MPVTGPMDKFVIKTPANPSVVKPKSGPAADDEDEEPKESALHYDWREIVSLPTISSGSPPPI